jgi:predicted amidophosphoribosyltransferase
MSHPAKTALRVVSGARRLQRRLLGPALRFALPSLCFACGGVLGEWQRLGACHACWDGIRPLASPLCPRCALPRPAGSDLLGPARGRCAACLVSAPALDAVRAVVAYDSSAKRFLLRAKFGGRRELLRPLAERMVACLRASGIHSGCTFVAPVPSQPWTDLQRGFSASRDLARFVADKAGLPLRGRVLRRTLLGGGATKRLRAGQRASQVRATLRLTGSAVRARVLLIDDVMTTGATLYACAGLLRDAGATEVRALVWARTLPGREL